MGWELHATEGNYEIFRRYLGNDKYEYKRFRVSQWDISIPSDLCDDSDDGSYYARLADMAIEQAREESDDYVIPAQWEAERISGDRDSFEIVFRVRRYSN